MMVTSTLDRLMYLLYDKRIASMKIPGKCKKTIVIQPLQATS